MLRSQGQGDVIEEADPGGVVQGAGAGHDLVGAREVQFRGVLGDEDHRLLADALQGRIVRGSQDRREGDVLVVEEAIGRLHFRMAMATGGELQGGLLAPGIQDHLEPLPELDMALGLSRPGLSGLGLSGPGLGMDRAKPGGLQLLVDPLLHGVAR